MKYFLITHQENFDFAIATKYILATDWDIDAEIIVGHTISDKYPRTGVLHHNWIDYVLPKCIESGESCIVFEDDVRLKQNIQDLPYDDFDLIWFGFRRGKLTNKNHRVTGTQGLYLSKDILKDVYDNFIQYKRKIHLDHLVSKFCMEFIDKYRITQTKLSYCYEKEHDSLISLDDWSKYTK